MTRTGRRQFVTFLLGLALWMVVSAGQTAAETKTINVFAAASLGDVLTELGAAWKEETGLSITPVLAGSSVLARQITQGAPADIYISANPNWMDWLEAQGALIPETRTALVSNHLVLIAPNDGFSGTWVWTSQASIDSALGADGRLATALTEAVPAGVYARDALMSLGLWDALKHRLAETDNVRAALALVALGEAPLGIVYATDAMADPDVRVVSEVPIDSHPPILYPAAVVSNSTQPDMASAFLIWLTKSDAQAIFARHGFLPVEK